MLSQSDSLSNERGYGFGQDLAVAAAGGNHTSSFINNDKNTNNYNNDESMLDYYARESSPVAAAVSLRDAEQPIPLGDQAPSLNSSGSDRQRCKLICVGAFCLLVTTASGVIVGVTTSYAPVSSTSARGEEDGATAVISSIENNILVDSSAVGGDVDTVNQQVTAASQQQQQHQQQKQEGVPTVKPTRRRRRTRPTNTPSRMGTTSLTKTDESISISMSMSTGATLTATTTTMTTTSATYVNPNLILVTIDPTPSPSPVPTLNPVTDSPTVVPTLYPITASPTTGSPVIIPTTASPITKAPVVTSSSTLFKPTYAPFQLVTTTTTTTAATMSTAASTTMAATTTTATATTTTSSVTTATTTSATQQSSSSFRLKMYWDDTSNWTSGAEDQPVYKDPLYCMECSGDDNCLATNLLYIKKCNESAMDQQFIAFEDKTLRPKMDATLCFTVMSYDMAEDNDGQPITEPIQLQLCNNHVNQQFVGYENESKKKFELHPISQIEERCLGQFHHPKEYEKVYPDLCDWARDDNTSNWIAY